MFFCALQKVLICISNSYFANFFFFFFFFGGGGGQNSLSVSN